MQPEDYEEKQYEDEPESYPIDEFQLTTTPNDFNIITIISFIKSNHLFRLEMMKRLIVLVLLASTLLTGCNTARGFGEDIKHLGNSISRAAS